MKAIGYAAPGGPEVLQDIEVPVPAPGPRDILVRVEAISVNPVDAKVRAAATPADGAPRILGWDAAGVVEAVGSEATLFAPGDEVWYAGDVTRAGGVTVLRGFPQGDSAAFKKRLAAIWRDGSEAGALGIDPRLFRTFDIAVAPSFVMVASDFSPCDGFDCTDTLPPHDRIAGNVSVEDALETFADGGGPGAQLARLPLARPLRAFDARAHGISAS